MDDNDDDHGSSRPEVFCEIAVLNFPINVPIKSVPVFFLTRAAGFMLKKYLAVDVFLKIFLTFSQHLFFRTP